MSDIEDIVTGSETTTDFMLILFEGNVSTTSELPNFNDSLNGTERFEINPFILPWWRQLIWTILFAGMVIVASGGNLIVIWIVMAHKRMRTVTNYFLVNLSVADAMVSTLNVTFNYTYMLNSDWPFGKTYCKITQFVAVLSICASVFTLMAISVDRYMAIISPLRPRMGRRTTLIVVVCIWMLGSTLSLPMIAFYTTDGVELAEGDVRIVCYSEWPDGPSPHSYYEYVYNVVFMVVTYFLPIGSMTFTYLRVGVELWGSQSIGECTQRQMENIRSKRRVVKMMVVVVLIFVVCWAPFHIYFIVVSLYPQINQSPYVQEVYLGIYWLAMSNSMYNPIIYFWMNSRFRRGFKQFFSWCPFVHVPPETLSRREAVTSRYSYSGSPEAQCRIVRNGGSAPMTSRVRSKLTTACEIGPSHRSTDSTLNCSMRVPLGSAEAVGGSDSAGACNYQTFRNGSGTSSGGKRWRGVS